MALRLPSAALSPRSAGRFEGGACNPARRACLCLRKRLLPFGLLCGLLRAPFIARLDEAQLTGLLSAEKLRICPYGPLPNQVDLTFYTA